MATSTLGSGTLVLAGTTSGTTTVTATAVAGTTTLTLPAATDTLVGKATTDTLTNKTLTTPSVSSPTISDGTINGVAFLNGAKVLTTDSALVFNGTDFGIGTAAPSGYLSGTAKLVVLVNANAQHSLLVRNDSAGSSASSAIVLNGNGNQWGIECGSSAKNSNALTFQIDYNGTNSTKMTLDTSGNLLVGATATTGLASNAVIVAGGRFRTVSGSVSAATATATTLFTAPTALAAWLVTINVDADSTIYSATYIVNTQGGSSTVATQIFKGANVSISVSGYDVKATQSSGATATIQYSAVRIF
jgi:hypothetical protein